MAVTIARKSDDKILLITGCYEVGKAFEHGEASHDLRATFNNQDDAQEFIRLFELTSSHYVCLI